MVRNHFKLKTDFCPNFIIIKESFVRTRWVMEAMRAIEMMETIRAIEMMDTIRAIEIMETIAQGQSSSRALADKSVMRSEDRSVFHRQVPKKVDSLPKLRPEVKCMLEVAGHQSNQAPWEAPWVATLER